MPQDILLTGNFSNIDLELRKELIKMLGNNISDIKIFFPYINDIELNENKDIKLIDSGIKKLSQSLLKAIYTQNGENIEDINYGGNLKEFLGRKVNGNLWNDIVTRIKNVLEKHNELNSDNTNLDEKIAYIEEISVYSSKDDPRILFIDLKIRTYLENLIKIGLTMEI